MKECEFGPSQTVRLRMHLVSFSWITCRLQGTSSATSSHADAEVPISLRLSESVRHGTNHRAERRDAMERRPRAWADDVGVSGHRSLWPRNALTEDDHEALMQMLP